VALFDTVDTLNSGLDIGGTLTALGRGGNDSVAFGQVGGSRTVYLESPPVLNGGGGNDVLVIVNLYLKSELVDVLDKLGSVPSNFETILI
jgi:hypothetical protein